MFTQLENPEHTLDRLMALNPLAVTKPQDLRAWSNATNWEPNQFPQTEGWHKWLNQIEVGMSNPGWPDFSYYINDIGFRDRYPKTKSKRVVGFFGCSFTFGQGLPTQETFPYLIAQDLGLPYLNLGMCGFGHHMIAQTFLAAVQLWNLEYAVITFPNIERFNYVTTEDLVWPVHPHNDHQTEEHRNVHRAVWKYFSPNNHLHQFKDSVVHIIQTARQYGVKLLFGTWGGAMPGNIIKRLTDYDLTYFVYSFNDGKDLSRDRAHPGKMQHIDYALKISKRIQQNEFV